MVIYSDTCMLRKEIFKHFKDCWTEPVLLLIPGYLQCHCGPTVRVGVYRNQVTNEVLVKVCFSVYLGSEDSPSCNLPDPRCKAEIGILGICQTSTLGTSLCGRLNGNL